MHMNAFQNGHFSLEHCIINKWERIIKLANVDYFIAMKFKLQIVLYGTL